MQPVNLVKGPVDEVDEFRYMGSTENTKGDTEHGVEAAENMKAAAQDRSGWRKVVCGLCSTGSEKS